MTIWIDGTFAGGASLPRPHGIAPFETIGAVEGTFPLWQRHLTRLRAAAHRLELAFEPPVDLRAAASELVRQNGHTDGVLRLELLPDAARPGACRIAMKSRLRSPVSVVRLLPTVVPRPADAPPGDMKAKPRTFWDRVRQQAQDGGADDGLVVDEEGQVLEAATGNLFLLLDGRWVTPPLDGRVLPGIARAVLLCSGAEVREQPVTLSDLHRADALVHSNAVHGPRPASLLGERAHPDVCAAAFGAAWRRALAGD